MSSTTCDRLKEKRAEFSKRRRENVIFGEGHILLPLDETEIEERENFGIGLHWHCRRYSGQTAYRTLEILWSMRP